MIHDTKQTHKQFSEDPQKQWYVLRITYHRVQKAYDLLIDEEGIEVYMPLRYIIRNQNGYKCRITTPLLPNLLFVYAKYETIDNILKNNIKKSNTKNLITYYYNHFNIGNNGKNPPLTVPYNAMMNFIHLTSLTNEHIRIVHSEQCHYRSGDLVRIVDGEFAGIKGRVARVAGQQRVIVELDGICLVMTAYIPSAFIEKI